MAGLSNHEDASQKSKPYRIKRDNRDVEKKRLSGGGEGAS